MKNRDLKTLVFIPAYNEEKTLAKTVEDLKLNGPECDYVVIDDGSLDGTKKLCEQNGYPVIALPFNLGLDGVFRTGLSYAYENGYDAVIPFDADGQHNAGYIAPMLDKLREGSDIVIGSRFLNKKKGGSLRMLGSRVISAIFKLTTKTGFTDPTSGMRLVSRDIMKEILDDQNCGPEPDTWAFLVKNGYSLTEVPVEMNSREQGESYFTFGRSIFFMLRMCISIIFINFFRTGGKK